MTFSISLRRLTQAAGLAARMPSLASPITSTTDPSLAGATVYDFSDMPTGAVEIEFLTLEHEQDLVVSFALAPNGQEWN